MPNPLLDYYKAYYNSNGYTLEGSRDFSRVQFLIEFVRKYTPKGGRILDVGCGDMYLSQVCPEFEWVGVDINTTKAKGKAMELDLMVTPYPFEAGSFDTIICSEVLEHVWDLRVIHKEIFRLLSPKGVYVMSTPNFDHIDHFMTHYRELITDPDKPHTMEHIRFYNTISHRKFLDECGFKEIEHVGADAQYSHMFVAARMAAFVELGKIGYSIGQVDKLIGRMFPDFSHTLMFVANKK